MTRRAAPVLGGWCPSAYGGCVQVASRTETGHVRQRNEDSLLVEPDAGVFAVLDGLGGHPAGDVASGLAARALGAALAPPALSDADDPEPLLLSAVEGGHEAIRAAAADDPDLAGMATTVVLSAVRDQQVWLAHVGDSRAYLLTDGRFEQVTRDHGMGGYLTQALGLDGGIAPDVNRVTLSPGSRLLLCSDGLTNMVDDAHVAALLADGDPQQACDALIEAALDAGGVDNVTLVVVQG